MAFCGYPRNSISPCSFGARVISSSRVIPKLLRLHGTTLCLRLAYFSARSVDTKCSWLLMKQHPSKSHLILRGSPGEPNKSPDVKEYGESAVSQACNAIERSINGIQIPARSLVALAGKWKSLYAAGPDEKHRDIIDNVVIKAEPDGISFASETSFHGLVSYSGEGKVYQKNQIIGQWTHPTDRSLAEGLFMLMVNPTADIMYGYSTTFDVDGALIYGTWVFAKKVVGLPEEEVHERLLRAQKTLIQSTISPFHELQSSSEPPSTVKLLETHWYFKSGITKELLQLELRGNRVSGIRRTTHPTGTETEYGVSGWHYGSIYWLEYHLLSGSGGGSILLDEFTNDRFSGLLLSKDCYTGVKQCRTNIWFPSSLIKLHKGILQVRRCGDTFYGGWI